MIQNSTKTGAPSPLFFYCIFFLSGSSFRPFFFVFFFFFGWPKAELALQLLYILFSFSFVLFSFFLFFFFFYLFLLLLHLPFCCNCWYRLFSPSLPSLLLLFFLSTSFSWAETGVGTPFLFKKKKKIGLKQNSLFFFLSFFFFLSPSFFLFPLLFSFFLLFFSSLLLLLLD